MTAADGLGAGEIPAYGKGSLPPNIAEAEGFLDDVDDVARLIEVGGVLEDERFTRRCILSSSSDLRAGVVCTTSVRALLSRFRKSMHLGSIDCEVRDLNDPPARACTAAS
jgi:hypothetical protein